MKIFVGVVFTVLMLVGIATAGKTAKALNSAAVPVGSGWWCSVGSAEGERLGSMCTRAKSQCQTLTDDMRKGGFEMSECAQQDTASVFTYHRDDADVWTYSAATTDSDCVSFRDFIVADKDSSEVSPCSTVGSK